MKEAAAAQAKEERDKVQRQREKEEAKRKKELEKQEVLCLHSCYSPRVTSQLENVEDALSDT